MDPRHGKRDYWSCPVCSLIFLPKEFHLTVEEEKRRYDYHQNSPNDPDYVKFLSRLADPLMKHLKKGQKGLDFGCGPGPTMSVILKGRGVDVEDYDPIYSPKSDLLKRKYDFVTCSETVEHFRNPRRDFLLIDQLLNSSGVLGLMTEVFDPKKTSFGDWWYHKDPTHISFYRQETFKWIEKWRGWKIEFTNDNIMIAVH